MMADPRMEQIPEMPFDGKRMILGGFDPFVDVGSGRGAYFDGYVMPVAAIAARPTARWQKAEVFLEHGAARGRGLG